MARSLRLDRLALRAAALSYLTLLALVPLATLALMLLETIGLQGLGQRVRGFLLSELGLSRETALLFEQLISRANAQAVEGLSGLLLLGSSLALLINIEGALDEIWGVAKPRPLMRRLLRAIGLLMLGPVLLGIALALSARLSHVPFPIELGRLLGPGPEVLLIFSILFVLYVLGPNTKVAPLIAGLSALAAALVWEAAKRGYAFIAIHAFQQNALVYGSLAAIPVLMLWIQLSWLIVLGGSHLNHALQSLGRRG
jgi:membrane protein